MSAQVETACWIPSPNLTGRAFPQEANRCSCHRRSTTNAQGMVQWVTKISLKSKQMAVQTHDHKHAWQSQGIFSPSLLKGTSLKQGTTRISSNNQIFS